MRTIRKILKFLFLGTILLLLSIGYRVLWEKKGTNDKRTNDKRSLLGLDRARADVPSSSNSINPTSNSSGSDGADSSSGPCGNGG